MTQAGGIVDRRLEEAQVSLAPLLSQVEEPATSQWRSVVEGLEGGQSGVARALDDSWLSRADTELDELVDGQVSRPRGLNPRDRPVRDREGEHPRSPLLNGARIGLIRRARCFPPATMSFSSPKSAGTIEEGRTPCAARGAGR